MFGCMRVASGYPRIDGASDYTGHTMPPGPNQYGATRGQYAATFDCNTEDRYGWIAALYFIMLIVIGGLIMPTVLIGIICISFEESQGKLKKVSFTLG